MCVCLSGGVPRFRRGMLDKGDRRVVFGGPSCRQQGESKNGLRGRQYVNDSGRQRSSRALLDRPVFACVSSVCVTRVHRAKNLHCERGTGFSDVVSGFVAIHRRRIGLWSSSRFN